MNHSFAIDEDQLGDNKAIDRGDAKKRKHLVASCPADRERRLLFFGKIAYQKVGIVVECNIERLEATRSQLVLKPAHYMRRRLAMRARGEDEFECDYLTTVLAEELLAFPWDGEGYLRSFSNSRRERTRRE